MGFSWEVARHFNGQPLVSPNRVRVNRPNGGAECPFRPFRANCDQIRAPLPSASREICASTPRQGALRRWIKFASGQTPPIAMKPAGRLLGVLVRANRLDAGAPILSERLPEAIADIGVASAGKFIKQDLAQKTRLPFALRHSSQAGNGWVAPALATTTSLSPVETVAPSPLITVI